MSNINEMSEFEKEEKLYTIEDFCGRYPIGIFHEPDKEEWYKINKVLNDNGLSLDVISASNRRDILDSIKEIITG